jgi:hypothetical protein
MRGPLLPHVSIFTSLSPHRDHLKLGTPEWRKKSMKKWRFNGTLQLENGSKKFCLTARSLGGLGGSRHQDPLPSSHPRALSARAYEKDLKENTFSHITIPKYRQAVGDWRVLLYLHGSKFMSLSPHPNHLKPGSLDWSKKLNKKLNTWICSSMT